MSDLARTSATSMAILNPIASLAITVVSMKRLMESSTLIEYFIGAPILIMFGINSLYLILRSTFKTLKCFSKYRHYLDAHKPSVKCLAMAAGLIWLEILFFSYTPDDSVTYWLRIFSIVVTCPSCIVILLVFAYRIETGATRVAKLQRAENETDRNGQGKPP